MPPGPCQPLKKLLLHLLYGIIYQKSGEFLGEEDNIEDGFTDIGVQVTERVSPLIDILSQSLVWVGDSGIDISKL